MAKNVRVVPYSSLLATRPPLFTCGLAIGLTRGEETYVRYRYNTVHRSYTSYFILFLRGSFIFSPWARTPCKALTYSLDPPPYLQFSCLSPWSHSPYNPTPPTHNTCSLSPHNPLCSHLGRIPSVIRRHTQLLTILLHALPLGRRIRGVAAPVPGRIHV